MTEVTTYTMAGETREWALREGATVQDLCDEIRIWVPGQRFELWKIQPDNSRRLEEDGLLGDINDVTLIWADDAPTVLERVQEAMIGKAQFAAMRGDEEVLLVSTSAISMKFVLEFALFALRCTPTKELVRQCEEGARLHIVSHLADSLALINDEAKRNYLKDALIDMLTWVMLYMAVDNVIMTDGFNFIKDSMNELFDASIR